MDGEWTTVTRGRRRRAVVPDASPNASLKPKKTPEQIITDFLRPRILFWAAMRKATKANTEWPKDEFVFGMNFCTFCPNVCFRKGACTACEAFKARDPVGFARSNMLCTQCFAREDMYGCSKGCDDIWPAGPCNCCGREVIGSDWACYGLCSRGCAASFGR